MHGPQMSTYHLEMQATLPEEWHRESQHLHYMQGCRRPIIERRLGTRRSTSLVDTDLVVSSLRELD